MPAVGPDSRSHEVEPNVMRWAAGEECVYTYTMLLAREDPREKHTWLVLYLGATVPPEFWTTDLGKKTWLYGHRPGVPLLMLPRRAGENPRWTASLTTSDFVTEEPGPARKAGAVGVGHVWTCTDPVDLAERVAADLRALFPQIAGASG